MYMSACANVWFRGVESMASVWFKLRLSYPKARLRLFNPLKTFLNVTARQVAKLLRNTNDDRRSTNNES